MGLLLRFASVLFVHTPMISDDKDYDQLARSLVEGRGFVLDGQPTAYRTPGYPLIIAAVYAIVGESILAVKFLQAGVDILSCFLIFAIGKKLLGEDVGFLAAVLLALFPIQILYVSLLMTETIFTCLLLCSIYLLVSEGDRSSLKTDIYFGVLIGVAGLVRPVAILLPLVVFLYRRSLKIQWKENIRRLVLICLTVGIVLSPWVYRNYIQFGRLTITNSTGINFWIGNHHGASGTFSLPQGNPLQPLPDDFKRSDVGIKLGTQFIVQHPGEYLFLLAKKFEQFFSTDYWVVTVIDYHPVWRTYHHAASVYKEFSPWLIAGSHIPYYVLLLLGTFGLVCSSPKDDRQLFLIRAVIVYWLSVHLIFFALARFRFPIVPLILIGAAYGYYLLKHRTFSRNKFRLLTAALLSFLFLSGWFLEYWTIHQAPSEAIQTVPELRDLMRSNFFSCIQ
jgi:4-amino-4-deoxy-L-arabinose transferase-like glycosyltransferase